MSRHLRRFGSFGVSCGALGLLAHCGGGNLTLPNPREATSMPAGITIVKGDAQSGVPGTLLRDSLVVKVSDSAGDPLTGAQVEFAPDAPGAAVTPQTPTTGADGMAGARWVLGETTGEQEVVARVVGEGVPEGLQVRFTASVEAVPPPPSSLGIRTQPSSSATVAVAFDRQPEVQIQDEKGKDVKQDGVPVTAAVATGAGSLRGTTTQLTNSKGRAVFTDLMIEGATGSHVLIFAANGYTSITSSPIEVAPGTPAAGSDAYNTIEGATNTLTVGPADGVLHNDRDPEGEPLTASDASDPPNGTVTLYPDGSFTYNPVVNFFGDDSFTYRVSDPAGNSSRGMVTIHVAPVNDAPWFTISINPVYAPAGGIPQAVSNFATGISPGAENEADQALTFEVVGNSNPALFASGPTVVRDGQGTTATLSFTPAPGQVGASSVSIILKDNGGTSFGGFDTSWPQTFYIVVQ